MQLENRPNGASISSVSMGHEGTGLLIYTESIYGTRSATFLLQNRLLLFTDCAGHVAEDPILGGLGNFPVLAVYDLDQASASQDQGLSSPTAVFTLKLAADDLRFNPGDTVLHYCLDTFSHSDKVAVPFFRSPSEDLISLQLELEARGGYDGSSYWVLLIPMVGVTSHFDGAAADDVPIRCIPWNDWGATGTRWVPGPGFPQLFYGALSGLRFIHSSLRLQGFFIRVFFKRLGLQPCSYRAT